MKRVVIVGGGITGLSAAYTLEGAIHKRDASRDVDYLLIEGERRLGGKILTEYLDGFTIEGGPDCFLSEKPWVAELSSRIGIPHRLLPSNEENKGTFVLSRGRLHQLPEGLMLMVPTRILPFVMSPLISPGGKIRMAMELVIPPRKHCSDESLASFVTRRLGREALEKIAEPLIGGIHCCDAREMSLMACFPRFARMEREHGSLIRAMLAARKKGVAQPHGNSRRTYFMSFAGGMGELPRSVAARLTPGRLLAGRRVTKVEAGQEPGGRPSYLVHVEGGPPVSADALILAIPANHAATLMRHIDPGIAEVLGKISLASSATVSLGFRRDDVGRPLEGFGFVVPRTEKRKIMAVTYSSTKWDHRTPGDDYILLRAFVGGADNQHLAHYEDPEIISLVRAELEDILGITAEPVISRVYRWIKGMTQYTIGHLERVSAIEERLEAHPGLYLAGGSYRGIGIGDCINSGTAAAQRALDYLAGFEKKRENNTG